ncbi:MAG: GAF domain-containing protein, partial [Anaerolineae bacterium]
MLFLEKETGYLHPHHSYRVKRKVTELISVPPTQGLIGRVIASGRPVRVDDVHRDEAYLLADPDTRSEVCVPLKVGQRVIGVINAESPEVGSFSAQDERFLLTLARQLSTAIEKIRLIESERARRQEEERLRAAISNLSGDLELEQVLDNILIQLEQVVPFDSAAVFLVQGDQISLVAGRGFPDDVQVIGKFFPRTNPLVAAIEAAKQPICLTDAQADGRFHSWGGATYIRGWMGVPLISRGIITGLLTMDSRATNVYGDTETVLAQAFANQAAIAIENARLYEVEQQARYLADTLWAANQALTQSLDPVIVGDSLLDFLQQFIPYDSAALMLLQQNDRVILHNVRGFEQFTDETAVQKFTFNLGSNRSIKTVIQSRKSLLIPDTKEFEGWERRSETGYVRSWLGVPLIAGSKPIGLFSLDKAEPDFFNENHRQLAESLAAQTAVALQNAQFFTETRQRADEMTLASDILLNLNATPDVTEVFPHAATVLQKITGCDRATLTHIDPKRQEGTMLVLDQPRQTYGQGAPIQFNESAAAADILSGKVHIANDLREELDFPDAQFLVQAGYLSRINFPLLVGNEVIGSLNFAWEKTNGPNLAQIPLLRQIASAISLAQERSRLFNTINRQARQLGLLNLLSQQVTSQLDSQELYTTVVSTLHQSLDYARVSIFTVDKARQTVILRALVGSDDKVHWVGQDVYQQKLGEGLIGRVAAIGDRLLVNDTRDHPDFLESQNFPVCAELVLPLKVGSQVIGVLNLDHDEYNAFSEADVTILSVIADQLAVSLEKARLIEESRKRTIELETLTHVSAALRTANSVDSIVKAILSQVSFGEQTVRAIFLLDQTSGQLIARGSAPPIPGFKGQTHSLSEGITGRVAVTGEPHLSPKLADDPLATFLPEEKETLAQVY